MRIAELIDRSYGKVHTLLRRLSGSALVAEDLTQEAFLRLAKLRDPQGRLEEAYLMRVAYTCWLRHAQRRPPPASLEDVRPPPIRDNPQDALERSEQAAAVRRGLAQLPADDREILVVVTCLGYTFVEASALLGVPRTTLVYRHRRALECLKTHLRAVAE